MTEIIAAAEVEEMLTPERGETFCFSRPMTAEEAKHAEDLYLSDEFKRDKIMSVVCVFDGLLRYVINADRGNDLNDILFNAVLDTMEAIVTAALDQAYEYGKEA